MTIKFKACTEKSEWLKQRARGIGGSDAGALLGLNPYKSPYTLWAEKTGKLKDTFEGNEKTRQGNDFEDYVAKRFTEETGKKVRKTSFMYQHEEYPFMLANPDRLIVGENAGLECKTAGQLSKWDYESGQIPPWYYAQCQHYMTVMDADVWYLAILVFQTGFYVFKIERDPEESAALVEAEKAFWHSVESLTPPAVDGSDNTRKTLETLYPADKEAQEVSFEVLEGLDFERYFECSDQIKALTAEKKEIQNRCAALMGECTKGETEAFKVTYNPSSSRKCDYERLAVQYPEAYESCVSVSESRPLKITKKKQKKGE